MNAKNNAPAPLPSWDELAARPELVDTAGRYLDQIACVLRPASVTNLDSTLRAFVAFLLECAPEVTSMNQINRQHIVVPDRVKDPLIQRNLHIGHTSASSLTNNTPTVN